MDENILGRIDQLETDIAYMHAFLSMGQSPNTNIMSELTRFLEGAREPKNEVGIYYKKQLEMILGRTNKPKLNKYRWREMKDEKPSENELVIVKDTNHQPFIAYYLGGLAEHHCRWRIDIKDSFSREYVTNEYATKWRKMCKLPGEK